jgi:hypothetical protein
VTAALSRVEPARSAALLREYGFSVCKPDPAAKAPTHKGWSAASLEPWGFRAGDQLGIIGGPLSDGGRPGHALVIIDLDAAEAVARADDFLPVTAMVEGRPSKPRSHRFFLVPFGSIPTWAVSTAEQAAPAARRQKGHSGPFTKSLRHAETDREVIKFIGTGGQVVCPPSLHHTGERRGWAGGQPGEPAVVPFLDLWNAVNDLAESCGARRVVIDLPPPPPRPAVRYPAADADAVLRRAVAYLGTCEGAVSEQGGHARTFGVARALAWGFDLGERLCFELLRDVYNPKCSPAWTEAELRHKARDADTLPCPKPRGWLRDRDTDRSRRLLASTVGRLEAFADRKEAARRGH